MPLLDHNGTCFSRTPGTSLESFNRQLARAQLLHFLDQQPSTPTQLLSMLQVELTNIEDIYNSCKTTIISAIDLLHTNPSFD